MHAMLTGADAVAGDGHDGRKVRVFVGHQQTRPKMHDKSVDDFIVITPTQVWRCMIGDSTWLRFSKPHAHNSWIGISTKDRNTSSSRGHSMSFI